MNIDLHGHIVVRELLGDAGAGGRLWYADASESPACLRRATGERVPFRFEAMDLQRVVENLERLRIDVMALTVVPPQIDYGLAAADAVAAARTIHEAIGAAVDGFPDRFVGLGSLPLQHPALAADELKRLMADPRMRGVELGSNVDGVYLGDERFWPVWEAIEETDAVVLIHPVNVMGKDRLAPYFLDNLIGNPVETARCCADLVFSGVLQRYPRLKIVLSHAGGAGPALWGR